MNLIDLEAPTNRTTVMLYGSTRSGKTRHAATWPRPLFLSDAGESGWVTIQNMDASEFYEPKRPPMVAKISTPAEMIQALVEVPKLIQERKVATVVIDSITFYADQFRTHVQTVDPKIDTRQAYGKLSDHLMYLRDRVHAFGCNVVWLALNRSPSTDEPGGGPAIPGQSSQKFAASCDYIMYARSFVDAATKTRTYEIRTRTFEENVAGGRDMGYLPDPLASYATVDGKEVLVVGNDYRTFETVMKIPPFQT